MQGLDVIKELDWNDLQFFLLFSRSKSFAVTAKQLNVNRTTVSRHLRELELLLKTKLFFKDGDGYCLTKDGYALMPYAEGVEKILLSMQGSGFLASAEIKGMVSLSLPTGMDITFYHAFNFSELFNQNCHLEVDLVTNDSKEDMRKKGVDLQITFNRPIDQKAIVRRLTDYKLGMFAAYDYIKDKPKINNYEDLSNHILISSNESYQSIPGLEIDKITQQCKKSTLFSKNLKMRYDAMLQGYGICIVPYFMVKPEHRLVQILPDEFEWLSKLWIVMHEDTRHIPRVRTVADHVIDQSSRLECLFLDKPGCDQLSYLNNLTKTSHNYVSL